MGGPVSGPVLAVSYATASPHAVAAFVAANYDLGPVQSCSLLNRGFNDIYAIETTQQGTTSRFIFRISGIRARGPADVADETAFIAHLAAAGVPVARPVLLRTGAAFSSVMMPEGPRAAVLFHEAPGHPPGLDTPSDAEAQARTLAALHNAAVSYQGRGGYALDADRLLQTPLTAISALGIQTPKTRDDLAALSNRLAARLESAAPTLTPIRCHGDCHGLNARIAPNGTATFFDFDEGGHGFLAYDLAVHLWAQISFGRRRHAIWHAFIAAYHATRSIPQPDMQAIDLFVPCRHLWLMGEFSGLTTRWGRESITTAWLERETAFLLQWESERLGPSLV